MSDHCTHPSVYRETTSTANTPAGYVSTLGRWRCVDCQAVVSIPGR